MNPPKPGSKPSRTTPSDVPDRKTLSTGERPEQTATETATTTSQRKAWIRKTPVEVVLDQIHKQEQRVAELEAQFKHEKRELEKLQKAKEVLEAK
jgi:hypothetical protein